MCVSATTPVQDPTPDQTSSTMAHKNDSAAHIDPLPACQVRPPLNLDFKGETNQMSWRKSAKKWGIFNPNCHNNGIGTCVISVIWKQGLDWSLSKLLCDRVIAFYERWTLS